MKIIVTIGPQSASVDTLHKLRDAGAESFRLNLSHLNKKGLEEYLEILQIANIKPALDTQGSQVRVTGLKSPLNIKQGDKLILTSTITEKPNTTFIQVNHSKLFEILKSGDVLKIDFNGLLVKINHVSSSECMAEGHALCDGAIFPNRAIDIANKAIELNHLSDFDEYVLKEYSSLTQEIYFSFTNNKLDIMKSKNFVAQHAGKNQAEMISYIAKIETRKGIANIDEIISESDAILIDRGDLSRELSISRIPGATITLNELCNSKSIPFYVATNILDSMMTEKIPSRSEISDLYSMLMSDVKGIVLAAEVAIGQNPIDSVKVVKYMGQLSTLQKNNLMSFVDDESYKESLPVHLRYWL